MSELLARVVDRTKWNTPLQNIQDAARGGKLDLAPNPSDA
jgi:hypothetical protein